MLFRSLAWWHMCQSEWDEARAECETAVRLGPRNVAAWELLLAWAQARNDQPLAGACRQALREKQRNHPVQWIETAAQLAHQKDWKSAEALLRKGLHQSRHPDVLHALASTIMDQDGDLAEVQALLDEALLQRPFQPAYQLAHQKCLQRQNAGRATAVDKLALCERQPDNAHHTE